jgi:hypothetical protein
MADTIGSVRQHVSQAIASKRKPTQTDARTAQDIVKENEDKSLWQWVEVPDYDLFGEPHTGVSVNFETFGPGKYFVSPELAGEIQRLLFNRLKGDMRVMQPNKDVKMAQIMARGGKRAPIMSDEQMATDLHKED